MDPCTFPVMHTLSIGLYPFRKGLWTPAHLQTQKLHPLARIPPGRGTGVFIHGSLHISRHGNSVRWPVYLQGGAPEFLSTDPCTFMDMETPSVGLYPSREGHWSFYPRTPAHFQTQKLRPLAHISREGHRSFYPWTPAHLRTWKLHPLACIPPGRGTRVFIHGSLHIYRHRNSVCLPVSLQGGALEFLSMDLCTFPDMETPSVGLYPSREGHRSFYPQIPSHLWTWKLRPLAHIPPGRGTRVFICRSLHIYGHGNSIHWPLSLQGGAPEFLIHRSLHIYGHGNSIHWPISLQGGAPEFLSTDPCTFTDTETPAVGPYPSREGHRSFHPWIPAHLQTWKLQSP